MQPKHFCTAGGHVNWCNHFENNLALFSKAGDVHIPHSTEISCLDVHPRETSEHKCQESFSQERYL